ncbi:MAG: anhydro-N-acetylmuramic acid kinase [Flavobacteriaceae bacterium]|nr:anhydro-N-acetylmuramic acid kinase [Flavobacteriaceae bacterium]
MKQNNYHILGVMSGTSLDGIDLAEVRFTVSEKDVWSFEIAIAETIAYSTVWKNSLQEALSYSEEKMKGFNIQYTEFLGEVISSFIEKHQLKNIDAVCSHGHTIWHQPENELTFQIGNLPEIASIINQKVICDFRVQDVALGGNGAPLVPIGDRLLFNEYDYCLNLGGFANISFELEGKRIAYDISPVNIVLNALTEKLGFPFDDGGKFASNGIVNNNLFQELNALKYYCENPPKSLGLEWVQEYMSPLIEASEISILDKIATVTEHVAFQLANNFEEYSSVLVTGGGTFNSYLLQRIQFYKKLDLKVPSEKLIEFKEALIFGLLGVLKLRNEINCLSSVTGADKDHCAGFVFEQ